MIQVVRPSDVANDSMAAPDTSMAGLSDASQGSDVMVKRKDEESEMIDDSMASLG